MVTAVEDVGQIVVYWGRDYREGSLAGTCSSGNYAFVIISYLSKYGGGQDPELSLGGHCDPSNGGCQSLRLDIQTCQRLGVKVLLSIGGPAGSYNLSGIEEGGKLANYLWNTFLGGSKASFRPFGAAALDGIDFDIRHGDPFYYREIPSILRAYGRDAGKKVYLTASMPCLYPPRGISDYFIDYVWIRFYNVSSSPYSCEYNSEKETTYKKAWNWWTTNWSSSDKKYFFGTLASIDVGVSGYIPPNVLTSRVLSYIKGTKNYGGVMLWNKLYDDRNGYAFFIRSNL